MSTPALVIGDMDLIRPLGLGGIRTIAAGPTMQETAWSKYSIDEIQLPDLWHQGERVVETLVQYGRSRHDRPTIMYQKDPAVLLLSRYRDVLSEYYRFLLPAPDTVEMLVDKRAFQKEAARCGLPVPASGFVRGPSGLDEIAELRFPVIVKPVIRDRTEASWEPVASRAKAIMCHTVDDLRGLLNRTELENMLLVVQEYVVGPEGSIVSYHALITPDRHTVGEFTGRKIRTRPREFGQSTAVEVNYEPGVIELGRRVLDSFGFYGVAKVDMKRDPDGELHVLEVNPRFNLWHHPGAVAGVNLPAATHRFLVDGRVDPLPPPRTDVHWVQVWGDLAAARERGVGTFRWARSAFRAKARRAFHWDDPGAILGAVAWGLTKGRGRSS